MSPNVKASGTSIALLKVRVTVKGRLLVSASYTRHAGVAAGAGAGAACKKDTINEMLKDVTMIFEVKPIHHKASTWRGMSPLQIETPRMGSGSTLAGHPLYTVA
jgi:hypothetical protein